MFFKIFTCIFILVNINRVQCADDDIFSSTGTLTQIVFNENGVSKALLYGSATGLTGSVSTDLALFDTIITFSLLSSKVCYSSPGFVNGIQGINGAPILDCKSMNFAFKLYTDKTDIPCTGDFVIINNTNPDMGGFILASGFCPGFPAFDEKLIAHTTAFVYPFTENGIKKQFITNIGESSCSTTPVYADIFTPIASQNIFYSSPCLLSYPPFKKITPIGSSDMVDCATGRVVGNLFITSCTGSSYQINSTCFNIAEDKNSHFLLSGACENPSVFGSSEDGGGGCFPGSALVQLENGNLMRMDKLQIGDRIQIGDNRTSEVFLFSHNDAMAETDFVEIVVSRFSANDEIEIKQNLRLTPGHLVYVYHDAEKKISAVPARDIRMGQFLAISIDQSHTQLPRVLKISTVRDKGLYNPHTLDGNLLVNGILVSSYTDAIPLPLAHALLAPARAMYEMGTFY